MDTIPVTSRAIATHFTLRCIPCNHIANTWVEEVDIEHVDFVVDMLLPRFGTICPKCEEMLTMSYQVNLQEFPVAVSWEYVMRCAGCGAQPLYIRTADGKSRLAEAMPPCLECGRCEWDAVRLPESRRVPIESLNDDLPF